MRRLRDAIEQYIDWMRSHGARFVRSAETLRRFARTVGDEAGCDTVSHDQTAAYLSRGALRASSLAFEYYALAGFYRYAAARGIATRSPLPAQPPQRSQPFPSYIYSDDEVRRLLAATEESRRRATQLEAHTLRTLLILLRGAGLRRGEALRLTLADVDCEGALLTIRETKFFKTRVVPLAQRVARSLEDYAARRLAGGVSRAPEAPFLVNRDGTPLKPSTVSQAFADLRRAAGVGRDDGAPCQPRLHDFRHSFAVDRLTAWYRLGKDVQALLPQLSTYLGHSSIAATQVYLRMTPALLEEASLRFERYARAAHGDDRD